MHLVNNWKYISSGGAEGDRTPDLRIANAALCQTELLPHAENDTTVSSFRFQVSGFKFQVIGHSSTTLPLIGYDAIFLKA